MRSALVATALVAAPMAARADDPAPPTDAGDHLAPHPTARWWLGGQINVIGQAQPGFHSTYEGDHSLRSEDHAALSLVATAVARYAITSTTTVVVTVESATGGGLSDALGLGGFTDLDVVRNPSLGAAPYIGRAHIDQVIDAGPGELQLHAGKLSTADYFDASPVGSDSHRQFMNWAVDNTGAYDYAADTRGYTLGAVVEYRAPRWAARYGFLLMPTVANGIAYDFALAHARGENLEVELRDCIAGKPGRVRVLAFWNHAKMGDYDEAIALYRQGLATVPDVTTTRVAGRVKYGFAASGEQELTPRLRLFARLGWNEGGYEAFAYTEVDNSAAGGFDLTVRGHDRLGFAAVTSGLSEPHRTYLAFGGEGFLLGDGRLHYGREDLAEAYYTARAYRGVFPAADVQVIAHPGYNADRGPVVVGSLRLHVEI